MNRIVVRVGGRGSVVDGAASEDPAQASSCDLCGVSAAVTASVTTDGSAPFACKDCLRARLEAMTLSQWQLAEPNPSGLPWGKISG
ncbi:MAG: hypothetical protein KF718_08215 [Polyangiaceae bacterium]|nr:hypothetical protein [Polyangiaceae bacterium]